jgi:transmembrane sensor
MMAPDPVIHCEPQDAISQRAADFLGRLRFGNWSNADQAELEEWLAASASHYVAWLRIEGIAARADQLAALNALEIRRSVRTGKFHYRRFFLPALAAACIATIALLVKAFVLSPMQPPDRVYSTAIGERTTLKFADGTVVDLNTDTAVRFRMTTAERTVWLQKGEAWFHVAHDAAHPFTVVAGKDRVTDLGTEFIVRRDVDQVEVALLKGRASLSAQGAPTEMLVPGDDAIATPASLSVTRKTAQELSDELAWRRGMLVFRDTRLIDAIREINRYNLVKLVIADPAIADLRFNGEIRNDDLQDFLGLAQVTMKLRAERLGEQILLSRAATEKSRSTARTKREP